MGRMTYGLKDGEKVELSTCCGDEVCGHVSFKGAADAGIVVTGISRMYRSYSDVVLLRSSSMLKLSSSVDRQL
jgi:hypothetical protein